MTYTKSKYKLIHDARIPRYGVVKAGEMVELSDMQFAHLPILIKRKLEPVSESTITRGKQRKVKTVEKKKETPKSTNKVVSKPKVVKSLSGK